MTETAVTCVRCGEPSPTPRPGHDWSPSVERDRRVWLCPRCAREHLRSLEAKLDPEHW